VVNFCPGGARTLLESPQGATISFQGTLLRPILPWRRPGKRSASPCTSPLVEEFWSPTIRNGFRVEKDRARIPGLANLAWRPPLTPKKTCPPARLGIESFDSRRESSAVSERAAIIWRTSDSSSATNSYIKGMRLIFRRLGEVAHRRSQVSRCRLWVVAMSIQTTGKSPKATEGKIIAAGRSQVRPFFFLVKQ